MSIRKRIPSDDQQLLEVWNRSVRATHTFLTEVDIEHLYAQVRDAYLPSVADDIWVYENNNNNNNNEGGDTSIAGFIGMNGTHVDMLFVDPVQRGQGIGTKLLNHVKSLFHNATLTLDVNEQNPQAHGFYKHYGFKDVGRSEFDSAGRPFPLIHMSL